MSEEARAPAQFYFGEPETGIAVLTAPPVVQVDEIMRLADEYGDTCDGRFEVKPEERDIARGALEAAVRKLATQPAEVEEYDETENAARHILAVMLDGETDEFNAWYKPEQWLGIHRAVAGFLKARDTKRVVPVAEVEAMIAADVVNRDEFIAMLRKQAAQIAELTGRNIALREAVIEDAERAYNKSGEFMTALPVVPVAEVEAMCDILEHKLPSIAGLKAAADMLRKLAGL